MYNSTNLPLNPLKIVKKSLPSVSKLALIAIAVWWGLFMQGGQQPLPSASDIDSIMLQMGWLAMAVVATLAIIKIVYEYLYYKLYYYDFGEDKAEIRKGVISRATGFVRYIRLQNIYVDQDFLDRVFGLYDVHYETAGETSGFYSHVDGLKRENSQKLVDFLNNRAKNQPQPEFQNSVSQPPLAPAENPAVAADEISSKTHPIAPVSLWAWSLSAWLAWGALCLVAYFFLSFFVPNFGILIAVVFVLMAVANFLYVKIFIRNFEFVLGPEEGRVRTQVIAQSISHFYYNRIQNINISQGIMDRLFGLYNVGIETAGEASSSELVLPGLEKEQAEEIRSFLLQKAQKARGL